MLSIAFNELMRLFVPHEINSKKHMCHPSPTTIKSKKSNKHAVFTKLWVSALLSTKINVSKIAAVTKTNFFFFFFFFFFFYTCSPNYSNIPVRLPSNSSCTCIHPFTETHREKG